MELALSIQCQSWCVKIYTGQHETKWGFGLNVSGLNAGFMRSLDVQCCRFPTKAEALCKAIEITLKYAEDYAIHYESGLMPTAMKKQLQAICSQQLTLF